MVDAPLPFLPPPPAREAADPASDLAAERTRTAQAAARLAADVDRRLAREQPAPNLEPIRRPAPEPIRAGSVSLPFQSVVHDPAGIAGAQAREVRNVPRRVVECVACEYRKLETRLGSPSEHHLNARLLSREAQQQHLGPGERDYTLCQICYDTNGSVHPSFFRRWARERSREDGQRTLRHDPRFAEIADRVTEVDRWRRGLPGEVDLGSGMSDEPLREPTLGPEMESGEYDGLALDERVPALSDFTGQTAGEGRSRLGNPDPEFALGAPYDPVRHRADELEARMLDDGWEARRKEHFRRAWERTEDILDPAARRQTRERLVQRWDPRMTLVGEDRMEMTSPFASVRPQLTPFARGVAHSGVDEGLQGEAAWRRDALDRHEAAVGAFLKTIRQRLAQQGVPAAQITSLTSLPDLNPGREIVKGERDPLHTRLDAPVPWVVDPERLPEGRVPNSGEILTALVPASRPTYLAPAAELDAVAREAAGRHAVGRDVDHLLVVEAARGQTDPEAFLRQAERARQRDTFQVEVRGADASREALAKLTSGISRADGEIRAAVRAFAREIQSAFRDPKAFEKAFSGLRPDQKREVLASLRDRPEAFEREFGSAGATATRARGAERTAAMERAGILTANAGERYLDAVRARDIVRAHAARELGLPETTLLKEVRAACETRLTEARQQKARALASIDGLGRVPSRRDLEQAFRGLTQQDRRQVMQAVPGLQRLLEPRGRGIARRGPSL